MPRTPSSILRPPPLTTSEYKAQLAAKRWRIADAAWRWNIRPDTLSKLIADPQRDIRWDDMLRALPKLSGQERKALSTARAQTPARPRRTPQPRAVLAPAAIVTTAQSADDEGPLTGPPGLRYQADLELGDELQAIADCDTFARDGEYAVLAQRKLGADDQGAIEERYCLHNPYGESRWFTPADLDTWYVVTGRKARFTP